MKQTAAVQQNITSTKCFPNIMCKTKHLVLILKVILLLKMFNARHQNVWYQSMNFFTCVNKFTVTTINETIWHSPILQ